MVFVEIRVWAPNTINPSRSKVMDRQTWTIAGIISTAVVAIILFTTYSSRNGEIRRQQTEIAERDADLEAANLKNTLLTDELAELRQKLQDAEARVHELEKANETAVASRRSLEDEMRSALEGKDITISRLQGRLTLNIVDQVLFDSGEARLRSEGEAVLTQVARFLIERPEIKVHVIGHTDNIPIRPDARDRFASNWELSLARSVAAVRFLSEQAGVDARRMGAVGYGEYRPVADNSTAAGRSKNRRIEIMVMPEELTSDAAVKAPEPAPPAPNN